MGSGLDAFVARALLAENAERSIDLQYYLYHDDLTGRLLSDQLIKAADRAIFFFDKNGLLNDYAYSLEKVPYETTQ